MEGLAILREKQEKKRKQEEEKQNRKEEREREKKKEREEQKARKKKQPGKRPKQKGETHPKCSKTAEKELATSVTETSTGTNQLAESQLCICCECSESSYEDDVLYGRGEEWVQCGCDKWIHKKCIARVEVDTDGKERFCSHCLL